MRTIHENKQPSAPQSTALSKNDDQTTSLGKFGQILCIFALFYVGNSDMTSELIESGERGEWVQKGY